MPKPNFLLDVVFRSLFVAGFVFVALWLFLGLQPMVVGMGFGHFVGCFAYHGYKYWKTTKSD